MKYPRTLCLVAVVCLQAFAQESPDSTTRFPDQIVQVEKLVAADPVDLAGFGSNVALSHDGNTLIVGAPLDSVHGQFKSGAAYIFVKSHGRMVQAAKLTTSDEFFLSFIGNAVAISGDGDTAVVASNTANFFTTGNGAAYVFVKPEGGWKAMTETAKLTVSDELASSFGHSTAVSSHGRTVFVGANPPVPPALGSPGAAYVFYKPATGWKTTDQFAAKLTTSDALVFDGFGFAMALSGNNSTLLVGAPLSPGTLGQSGPGAAYVFVKPTDGWKSATETAKLTASDNAGLDFDEFGIALSLDREGRTALIGAPNPSGLNGQSPEPGAAYLFERPESGWINATETAKLTAADSHGNDALGASVALDSDGDRVMLGAPSAPFNSLTQSAGSGRVYLYRRKDTQWKTTSHFVQKLKSSDGVPGDEFGSATSLARSKLVIGALSNTFNHIDRAGAVYVFEEHSE
jgi:hypothetical protein